MNKLNFQDIRDRELLLYEYVRGSTLYGLNTPTSDIDTAGVYMSPSEQLLGLGLDYQEQIADEKNDTVWYELNKVMTMLLSSNPTVLEALFVPNKMVIGEIHPIMKEIISHRNLFITKACFKPFGGYAVEQIRKARGLNKKIVNPITERLAPLDFAYTFYKQGSSKIQNWLEYRGLKQEYCGLVHIPNMHDTYGVYYDWGNHILSEEITDLKLQHIWIENLEYMSSNDISRCDPLYKFMRFAKTYFECESFNVFNMLEKVNPIGYKGMIGEDGLSNELRLSSVSKNEVPICHMTYNMSGYTSHCKDYKEFKDWEKRRNPIRYESNLNKNYDSKNIMHCMRLFTMCIEIAKGEGINLQRTDDREFLMKIRNHEFEYDEIINLIDSKKEEMDIAIANSTLPDSIDTDFVNDLLVNIRKQQLKIK